MSHLSYDECAAIEKAEGFDRFEVEEALTDAIEAAIGQQPAALESRNPGVVAMERVTDFSDRRLDWQRVVSEVARKTGVAALCVAHCDWQQDEGPDEEAVLIAFDIPSLPDDYRADNRNMIVAVDLSDIPTNDDFDRRDKAVDIVKGRRQELSGKAHQFKQVGKDASEILADIEELHKLQTDVEAQDREIVAAILDLDFDKAKELYMAATQPAPAPGM